MIFYIIIYIFIIQDDIMAFSIRLTEEEKALATSYAKLNSLSLGEAFKKALFEKIEDEYDAVVGDRVYEEYLKNGKKTYTMEEMHKELELD